MSRTLRKPEATARAHRTALPDALWALATAAGFLIVLFVAIRAGAQPAPESVGLETTLGDRITGALGSGRGLGVLWAYGFSFVAGLLTSLTPCVYPLIPITVGLFGARDENVTRSQAMVLAACYVGGIAAMYSTLGVVVGLSGGQFGALLMRPVVLVPVSLFLLAMAASMFGAFELALPSELATRLSQVGGKSRGGAFAMGLVAGLIAAPCTGPPLAALLVFVGTQRSVFLGGSLLFVYSLGLGVLFFAIAGFALKLPRSGPWMDTVKSVFGVVMIVAALYFLRSVFPLLRDYGKGTPSFLGLHVAAAIVGVFVGGLKLTFYEGMATSVRKAVGVLLITVGLYGGVAWLLAPKPVAGVAGRPDAAAPLSWETDEAAAVVTAKREGKPLFIDFGAEWCPPCKQMELKTFPDPRIQKELARFVRLRIDCSEETEANSALQKKYNSITLPSLLLFDKSGQKTYQVKEYVSAEQLLPLLEQTK